MCSGTTTVEWQIFIGVGLSQSGFTLRTDLAKALVLTIDSSWHIHLMALCRTHVVASPCIVGEQHALSHTASCRSNTLTGVSGKKWSQHQQDC